MWPNSYDHLRWPVSRQRNMWNLRTYSHPSPGISATSKWNDSRRGIRTLSGTHETYFFPRRRSTTWPRQFNLPDILSTLLYREPPLVHLLYAHVAVATAGDDEVVEGH